MGSRRAGPVMRDAVMINMVGSPENMWTEQRDLSRRAAEQFQVIQGLREVKQRRRAERKVKREAFGRRYWRLLAGRTS